MVPKGWIEVKPINTNRAEDEEGHYGKKEKKVQWWVCVIVCDMSNGLELITACREFCNKNNGVIDSDEKSIKENR